MKEYTESQVGRSLQRFLDYGSDLSSADYHTWDDRLAKFCHYCQNDPIFRTIHDQLRSLIDSDYDQWFSECENSVGSMAGSGRIKFPLEDENRIAYMYELLFRFEEGRIQFYGFLQQFFYSGSNRYDDYIATFNEAVTAPMIRDLRYKLDEMLEGLQVDAQGYIHAASIQIIHHAGSVIQQNASGSNIEQKASIQENPELAKLFEELRKKTDGNEEDLEVIAAAEEEAKKSSPKKSIVSALLKGLSCASASATIITSILGLLRG
jgi:hypothetical protein